MEADYGFKWGRYHHSSTSRIDLIQGEIFDLRCRLLIHNDVTESKVLRSHVAFLWKMFRARNFGPILDTSTYNQMNFTFWRLLLVDLMILCDDGKHAKETGLTARFLHRSVHCRKPHELRVDPCAKAYLTFND